MEFQIEKRTDFFVIFRGLEFWLLGEWSSNEQSPVN